MMTRPLTPANKLLQRVGWSWQDGLLILTIIALLNIPRELLEAARIYRLNFWQRFWTLELPIGAIGLVWNFHSLVACSYQFLTFDS